MRFFEKLQKDPRPLFMLLALVCAIYMWYLVSVQNRIEAQLDVNLDYYGIPPNLVVTSGLVNKMTVRVRGPEKLLRSALRDEPAHAVDLSYIKKGVTVVPLPTEAFSPVLRAFDIVDTQPPSIVVKADTMAERSVPVRTIVDSPLRGNALTVEHVSVSPATVIIRGPEEVISGISNLPLTIPLDPRAAGTTVQQTMPLVSPSLVTCSPSSVLVRYTITSGRAMLTRHVKIDVAEDSNHHYKLEPGELTLKVEVPEALAKSNNYLNELAASVTPPSIRPGESRRVRLRLRLPEGMTLVHPINEEVIVHRLAEPKKKGE